MPVIVKKNVLNATVLGIWEIQESEDYFLDRLVLSEEEKMQLSVIKGGRRLHWLCSRLMLHLMTNENERTPCLKDEFGKPHLHLSDLEISFSHSGDLVAVALSRHLVGIDIQLSVNKIHRIKHKFVRPEEVKWPSQSETEHLHWIWGAKEAAFKAYGRKQVDFLQHMQFSYTSEHAFNLELQKPEEEIYSFKGKIEQWGQYHLVYLIQDKD